MQAKQQLNHIIIEGMKHCGKSTHGRALANELDWPFFDTDELMIDGFEKQFINRPTIRELYLFLGENEFERFESQIIEGIYHKLVALNKRCVLALGGRVPAKPENREYLNALGKVIYLKVPSEILYQRSIRRGPVPFLDSARPEEHFKEIYQARESAYLSCADLVIELEDESITDVQRKIFQSVYKSLGSWISNPV